jgi:hypothetical protein
VANSKSLWTDWNSNSSTRAIPAPIDSASTGSAMSNPFETPLPAVLVEPSGLLTSPSPLLPHHVPYARELYDTNPPAPAQSRTSVGKTPRSKVTTTPSVMAAVVNAPGTLTVGPSAAGSLKYISTMTRR